MLNYREMAVETVKLAGQELIDRADELICKTEGVKDIDIWVRIPSLTDDPDVIPSIEVSTNVYPRRKTLIKIFEMKEKKDD